MTSDDAAGPPGADRRALGPWLARTLDDPGWLDCSVTHVAGGKSNLTYIVASPAGTVVVRRPPLRAVLPTAHDMSREYRVQAALAGTAVPVARMLVLCQDAEVIGAPFYVMERVEGPVVRDRLPPGYADMPEDRARIAGGLIDVLAELHDVQPAAVGLADFGRPDGYLSRQLRRWSAQWEASRSTELPALDRLLASLAERLPSSGPATLVHGDYRLDNTILDPDRPGRIRAVLDWEMSTLGDPLADVGLLLVYWTEPEDEAVDVRAVVPSVTALPGFPGRSTVAEMYGARSGRAVDDLPWYVAFGYFKLAVVCAGIAARHAAGAMVGEDFAAMGERVEPLVHLGLAALRRGLG
jgi:aminoglycoside phosphotransferase (APT) family kinase protein